MLTLHLLQSAPVPVHTRLVDTELADPAWAARMTGPDKRGTMPLLWSDIALRGPFELDLDTHLAWNGTLKWRRMPVHEWVRNLSDQTRRADEKGNLCTRWMKTLRTSRAMW